MTDQTTAPAEEPIAEWERELLEEQGELTRFLHANLPDETRCGCTLGDECPADWQTANLLACRVLRAGWSKPAKPGDDAEVDDMAAWPCANFGAPWTCLIPPEHTNVLTRCSFCVDQAAAAVALTPEEIERLAGRQL